MMNEIRLYGRYLRLHFLSSLQYKGWWIMCVHTLVVVLTDPLGTILMFSRFGGIGEWSMERILLMYAMAITSFGLAESFMRGFDYFPFRMVRDGGFDRLLVRPRSTVVQVAASVFHIHRLSRPVSGLAAVCWCLYRLNISMSVGQTALLVSALAGGFVMYSGVFILASGISFFSVKSVDLVYLFTNAGYQVTRIPIDLMPRILRYGFTFLLPMLVISYYPASVICGWGEPLWKALLALPAGLTFYAASFAMWRVGVRHYNSTGS